MWIAHTQFISQSCDGNQLERENRSNKYNNKRNSLTTNNNYSRTFCDYKMPEMCEKKKNNVLYGFICRIGFEIEWQVQ